MADRRVDKARESTWTRFLFDIRHDATLCKIRDEKTATARTENKGESSVNFDESRSSVTELSADSNYRLDAGCREPRYGTGQKTRRIGDITQRRESLATAATQQVSRDASTAMFLSAKNHTDFRKPTAYSPEDLSYRRHIAHCRETRHTCSRTDIHSYLSPLPISPHEAIWENVSHTFYQRSLKSFHFSKRKMLFLLLFFPILEL